MATIFVTLAANAVAEAFSRGLAEEIARKRRLTFDEAGVLLRNSLIVIVPGVVPALAFAAVSAGWLSLDMAFALACWFLVFVLFASGFMACKVNGCRVLRGLAYGLVISSFGLGIVALRLLVT